MIIHTIRAEHLSVNFLLLVSLGNFPIVLIFIPISAKERVYRSPIVYAEGAFYIIGDYPNVKTIGRLDAISMVWSNAGELMYAREAHNAIYDGTNIIVVGGELGPIRTESCAVSKGLVTCTGQDPSLKNYFLYPELFLVQADFCKNLP